MRHLPINKISLLLLPFLAPLAAFASEPCAPRPVPLVSGPAEAGESVEVSFRVEEGKLVASFEVKTRSLNVREHLQAGQYPFQFDVAEVFASATSGLPYYEFEATPLGQTFTVKIRDPKKPFESGLDLGLAAETSRTDDGWVAELRIPLSSIGWKPGRRITGNAFVILGTAPTRRFYALDLPKAEKPRFHQPEHFTKLLCE